MEYAPTISLDCPYCETKCQFQEIPKSKSLCKSDDLKHHNPYVCTNCGGLIITRWHYQLEQGYPIFMNYSPAPGVWKPKVNISYIENENVKEDFLEAIKCYNRSYFNACMIMARRAIQQEVISRGANEVDNLYQQIESIGISVQLKSLLHKIKNFGNYGAHPDFFLFDENGNKLEDKEYFAKLSLEFLDRYFMDQYETSQLIESAPKSEKEL